MTDKQIACAFLARRLWGLIPDHDELRDIAGQQLTEEHCNRIAQRVVEMSQRIRQPPVDYPEPHWLRHLVEKEIINGDDNHRGPPAEGPDQAVRPDVRGLLLGREDA
jgi:hypothetical protein